MSKLLIMLYKFEYNLELRNNDYVLKPEVAMLLEALVWAIQEANARHRLILVSRYEFESNWIDILYKQPLETLQ
ncbi:hypothetical protein [Nostoc sp. UHCC 0251]|uniref:hypothetical protein n=1 Tax=Nostoc sp. UHCC 0251 TaxID=3110240 RepID=UPI002B1EA22D|nr:hypothetical protein [Nostoc sp. UHCC 0251]MEA5628208.1 hypothetical protein [Nostoc sp. UHCC 0251]